RGGSPACAGAEPREAVRSWAPRPGGAPFCSVHQATEGLLMTDSDLVGFVPVRGRLAVRAAYARPVLTVNRLAAPLLVRSGASQDSGSLPGLVSVGQAAEFACRLDD